MKIEMRKENSMTPLILIFLILKDPAFLKVFKDKLASFKDPRTPKEIIIKIAKGWRLESRRPITLS